MSRWLEPIRYHKVPEGWAASARHLYAIAATKEAARAKLYRAHRRQHQAIATAQFRDLPTTNGTT